QMGLEKSLDKYLSGTPGKIQYKSDVWGFVLPGSEKNVIPPLPGCAGVFDPRQKDSKLFGRRLDPGG
ncbi:hypothetical protein, partial [Caldibacillus debilis]|uniref:hypothetical protein n=1 Tax=Caldibacillus debilis TaxID=301148 RepID=UPI0023F2B783